MNVATIVWQIIVGAGTIGIVLTMIWTFLLAMQEIVCRADGIHQSRTETVLGWACVLGWVGFVCWSVGVVLKAG